MRQTHILLRRSTVLRAFSFALIWASSLVNYNSSYILDSKSGCLEIKSEIMHFRHRGHQQPPIQVPMADQGEIFLVTIAGATTALP